LLVIKEYIAKSVKAFHGGDVNLIDSKLSESIGKELNCDDDILPVATKKNHLHIKSLTSVIEIAQSGLNATALRLKDYFRANASFQRKFKKLSYIIPFRYNVIHLHNAHKQEHRMTHILLLDRAIRETVVAGWKPIKGNYK
jgi:hypothetical protein